MPITEGSIPLALPGNMAQTSRKPLAPNVPLWPATSIAAGAKSKKKRAFETAKTAFKK